MSFANARNTYTNIYFFGDSLTDTGNLATAPYTNDPGIMWPHVVSEYYGVPLTIAGLLGEKGGNNWAVAGATSKHFLNKVETFLSKKPTINSNDLFILWIGSNDIIYKILAKWPSPASSDDVVEDTFNHTSRAVSLLQQAGAQHIMVINIIGVDITPYARKKQSRHGDEVIEEVKNVITKVNNKLAQIPQIYLYDAHTELDMVLADYQTYGFKNLTDPLKKCRGTCNPDEYIFWDGVHPTNAAHKLIGQFIIQFLEEVD
jgi:outer membrane lipase/esterase